MPSQAFSAFGTLIQRADEFGNFVTVAEAKSIAIVNSRADAIDVTNFDTPTALREYIAGLADGGEIHFDCNFIPGAPSQELLEQDFSNGTSSPWRLILPANFGRAEFGAIVISRDFDLPIDKAATRKIKLKVSGEFKTFWQANPAASVVQSAFKQYLELGTPQVSLSAAPKEGNLLIAMCLLRTPEGAPAISDTSDNTWFPLSDTGNDSDATVPVQGMWWSIHNGRGLAGLTVNFSFDPALNLFTNLNFDGYVLEIDWDRPPLTEFAQATTDPAQSHPIASLTVDDVTLSLTMPGFVSTTWSMGLLALVWKERKFIIALFNVIVGAGTWWETGSPPMGWDGPPWGDPPSGWTDLFPLASKSWSAVMSYSAN